MSEIYGKKRIPVGLMFLCGALLGVLSFIGIYGVGVLDFTNTGWLFYSDYDLKQHYVGWCHFRSDPWQFPIGLIDSLSYPNSMSVIYTDSIPIFAVLFKIMAPLLPVEFQYFGLFGIMSFALMGGLSTVLLRRFIGEDIICIIGSEFFITGFTVIHRMFYHTALAAQWIIILAIVLWVYDAAIKNNTLRCVYWGLMGFLCVSIHSYFLPMVGMILLALAVMQFLKNHRIEITLIKSLILPFCEILMFCVCGIFALWLYGGFYGGAGASGYGLGTFGSNMNTFINPLSYGRFLPELPLYYDFQYEGFAYLGCGILFLYFVVAAGLCFRLVRKTPEKAFHENRSTGIVSAAVVVVSILAATLPLLSFNDNKILQIPYPAPIEKILGVFRSNGRLIWVSMYILMIAAIAFAAYTFRQYRVVAILLVATALVIQIADQSKVFKSKYEQLSADYSIVNMWEDPNLSKIVEGKNEFIFMYNDNDITVDTAYFGYLSGMRQNNFYFARDIDDKVDSVINSYYAEMDKGNLRDGAVYIIKDEEYLERSDYYDSLDIIGTYADGHVIFTKR